MLEGKKWSSRTASNTKYRFATRSGRFALRGNFALAYYLQCFILQQIIRQSRRGRERKTAGISGTLADIPEPGFFGFCTRVGK